MKIPKSVRDLYAEIAPRYEALKGRVDSLVRANKHYRWHYESRIKEEESFALKLETGREPKPNAPEDFFGCLLVVENHSKVPEAVKLIESWFDVSYRRPENPEKTHLRPADFSFDDLRMYVSYSPAPGQKPSVSDGLVFEIQVKTFLQHAWGIATHDVIYKTDKVDWSANRIAFQVKAMLENAEISIAEAKRLTDATALNRSNSEFSELQDTLDCIQERWASELLPKDVRRLAENFLQMMRTLRISAEEFWGILDRATENGGGAKTLNLSPHGAAFTALLADRGERLFKPLESQRVTAYRKPKYLFVPAEIDVSTASKRAQEFLIRTA